MTAVRKLLAKKTISDAAYDKIVRLVKDACGIDIGEAKKAFLVGRLQTLLEREGYDSFEEFCAALVGKQGKKLLSELVDSVATNHTYFFRENAHFTHYQEIALKESIALARARRMNRLRVWCAASSSGQEPYTLAMLMMECLGTEYGQWDAGVLATDISNKILGIAREGKYPSKDLSALPKHLVDRYFERLDEQSCQVRESLRREVLFRRLNLVSGDFPFRTQFDVVFCRNVMIYFDEQTKRDLVRRIHDALRVGGYLYVGAAESLPKGHSFQLVAPSVFRRIQ